MEHTKKTAFLARVTQSIRCHLAIKFVLVSCLGVVIIIAGCGWFVASYMRHEISQNAENQATGQADRIADALNQINTSSLATLHSSVQLLQLEAGRIGQVGVGAPVALNSSTVPNLMFGRVSQVNNFSLVDEVKHITGASATLFVRRGEEYVRVSTNVMKPDGTRAVGTILDPNGSAIGAIRKGHPYYGIADILGTSYMTAYEPMRNGSGEVVGIWYSGIPITAFQEMGTKIQESKILDHGYVALLDAKARPVFVSKTTTLERVLAHLEKRERGWTLVKKDFAPWKYTVIAAYPQTDVQARLLVLNLAIFCIGLIAAMLMTITQYVFVRKTVLKPLDQIRTVAARIAQGDVQTSVHHESEDEIGVLAQALRSVIKYNQNFTAACESLSRGNLTVAVEAKSDKDLLANSFTQAVTSLRDTIREMAQSSTSLAAASEELSATSSQMSSNAQETAAQSGAVSSAAE